MQEVFLLEDVLNVLIQLEGFGNVHYMRLAALTPELEVKKLFNELAKQEKHHQQIYEAYKVKYIQFNSSQLSSEYQDYLRALIQSSIQFLSQENAFNTFEQGFGQAVQLEKETILFLTEIKALLPVEHHVEMDALCLEERRHLQFLMKYKKERQPFEY